MAPKMTSIPPSKAILFWHSAANARDIRARQASICTFGAVRCAFMAKTIRSMQPLDAIAA